MRVSAHILGSLFAGLVPEQTRQMEEKEEDHQCFPGTRYAAPNSGLTTVLCHGEQSVLVSRQRFPLGHGDAGGVSAAATTGPRSSTGHATVAVTVQSRSRPTTKLHGSLQRLVLQRLRSTVPSLPIAFPWNVGLSLRPHERIRLPAAV